MANLAPIGEQAGADASVSDLLAHWIAEQQQRDDLCLRERPRIGILAACGHLRDGGGPAYSGDAPTVQAILEAGGFPCLVGSCGSGWTRTIQRLLACSSQEQVAVRERVVAGITQAESSPVSQRYCSRRSGSLTSVGSWSERSTRLPWPSSRSRSSLSFKIPITVRAGVMEEV